MRCQGRRGREEQRATLLPLGGRGAWRDETKTPAWETSSSVVGEVYINSLYYENKQFLSLSIRRICGEGKGGKETRDKRR